MSWKKVQLNDVIQTLKGYAFKSSLYAENGVPIVRASNFTSDSVANDDLKYYSVSEAEKFDKYRLSTGDVLIQTVGSWEANPDSVVGKVVRVPHSMNGTLLNQNIVKVFPVDPNQLNLHYLFYRLKCNDFKRHNIGNAVGAANQASITLETIRAFEFLLPDISIQRHIADILSAYDDLIENNQKQIKLLEEAAQRLYKEWFVDLRFPGHETTPIINGVPESWKYGAINSLIELQSGFAFKSDDFCGNGTYKIVTIKNVQDGWFDGKNANTIANIPSKMPTHCSLNDNDILLSLTGNVGRVCIFNGENYLLNQRVAKIKSVHPAFAYCLFRSTDMFIAMGNLRCFFLCRMMIM